MRIRFQNELLLIIALVILLIIVISLFPSSVWRIILGLPLILFFPGYALVSVLFPRRSAPDGIERIALGFGFSIAIVALVGLILNYTPWGVSLYPVLLSITIFTIVVSLVAWLRRRRLDREERFTVSFGLSWLQRGGQSRLDRVLSVILIVAILGAAGAMVYAVAVPKIGERFTEFYVLGLQGEAIDHPGEMRVGGEERVVVGIINREHETASYRVEVRIDGVKNSEAGPVVLEHDAEWETTIGLIPDRSANAQKVEFLLYKNNEGGEAYRQLHLWIDVED